jgi:hypothetical protein
MWFRRVFAVRGMSLTDNNAVEIREARGKQLYRLSVRPLTDKDPVREKREGDYLAVATLEAEDLDICQLLAADAAAEVVKEPSLEVLRLLGTFAARTLRLLLWKTGVTEPSNTICSALSFSWSANGDTWKPLHTGGSLNLSVGPGFKSVNQTVADEVSAALGAGLSEPLGHELLREAWEHYRTAPRSALVIGMAAVEVAFKGYAGSLAPQAKWLLDELQTPPLIRMLKHFLPILEVKLRIGDKILIPPQLLRALERGVALRNTTVHSAAQARLFPQDVFEILKDIRDLLYLLDGYCGGQRWAFERVSQRTRAFLVAKSN